MRLLGSLNLVIGHTVGYKKNKSPTFPVFILIVVFAVFSFDYVDGFPVRVAGICYNGFAKIFGNGNVVFHKQVGVSEDVSVNFLKYVFTLNFPVSYYY